MQDFKPLTDDERKILDFTKKEIMKTWKYYSENMDAMDNNKYNVPISHVIRAYNSLLIQPNPYFGAELNYYKRFKKAYPSDYESGDFSEFNEKVGFDVNKALKDASEFLTKNSF